jgi:hypothetical protein
MKWYRDKKWLVGIILALVGIFVSVGAWMFANTSSQNSISGVPNNTGVINQQIGGSTIINNNQQRSGSRNPEGVSLLGECRPVIMPVTVSPHDEIHLLIINPKRIKSISWGIYDFTNDTDQPTQWPPKEKIHEFYLKRNIVATMYQCTISNLGNTNLTNVGLRMKWTFVHGGGKDTTMTQDAIVSPLYAGQHVSFYAVNDCNIEVIGFMPDTAKIKVAGSTTWQDAPLDREFKDPVEQVISFFPTTVPWIGDVSCD